MSDNLTGRKPRLSFPNSLEIWKKIENNISVKESGCWEWLLSKTKDGYGQVWFEAKVYKTHRVSYDYHLGLDPIFLVLHTCDNPPCVNPNHLFLGDDMSNSLDKVAKQRHKVKDEHPMAILTLEKVKAYRLRYKNGERISLLARESGVHWTTMEAAVKEYTWQII